MINVIKAALEDLIPASLKNVDIAHELEGDSLEKFEPHNAPSVLIYYGKTQYQPNEQLQRVRQTVDKRIVAILHCKTAEMDDFENLIVKKTLGLKKDSDHRDTEAVESITINIRGEYCCRRIEFSSESKINNL